MITPAQFTSIRHDLRNAIAPVAVARKYLNVTEAEVLAIEASSVTLDTENKNSLGMIKQRDILNKDVDHAYSMLAEAEEITGQKERWKHRQNVWYLFRDELLSFD